MDCVGCGNKGVYSILLAGGPSGDEKQIVDRVYIPNQHVRETSDHSEQWFCATCMRTLEDNFRATLLYLQAENGIVTVRQLPRIVA
jgi:hypothetical protein